VDASRYVVQRHRARRLHYDLRLEIGGVLVSWAVPKGPTLDPEVVRSAIRVGDHALDHFDFEGVIGTGDVIVWDAGSWTSPDDPAAALVAGELHLDVRGEKLAGRLLLKYTRGDEWILRHKRDAYAVVGWDPEEHPRSIRTGRTNEDVRNAAT
jgi:bifunctional non-homologous end joining protein LigD